MHPNPVARGRRANPAISQLSRAVRPRLHSSRRGRRWIVRGIVRRPLAFLTPRSFQVGLRLTRFETASARDGGFRQIPDASIIGLAGRTSAAIVKSRDRGASSKRSPSSGCGRIVGAAAGPHVGPVARCSALSCLGGLDMESDTTAKSESERRISTGGVLRRPFAGRSSMQCLAGLLSRHARSTKPRFDGHWRAPRIESQRGF